MENKECNHILGVAKSEHSWDGYFFVCVSSCRDFKDRIEDSFTYCPDCGEKLDEN